MWETNKQKDQAVGDMKDLCLRPEEPLPIEIKDVSPQMGDPLIFQVVSNVKPVGQWEDSPTTTVTPPPVGPSSWSVVACSMPICWGAC